MTKLHNPQNKIEHIAELHSRPFLSMKAGTRVSYLLIKTQPNIALEKSNEELGKICAYLKIEAPKEARNFFLFEDNDFTFKWEQHTEFLSITIYDTKPKGKQFSGRGFERLPKEWMRDNEALTLTSSVTEIVSTNSSNLDEAIDALLGEFSSESFAAASVLDGAAAVASDFTTDSAGHMRFAIVAKENIGQKRLGRISQRLLEIETYMVAGLMALPRARHVARELPKYEADFVPLISGISSDKSEADSSLHALLEMAAKIETMISDTNFRFGASEAYAKLVEERIKVLREKRLAGHQLFSEFMLRRFEPGMRTIASSQKRLTAFAERITRAATLLRAKVDVANAEGQRALLSSMNKRAEAQYRLQETVEGLSVVAISYYAISLLGYILAPISKTFDIEKAWLMAFSVPPVVVLVWLFIHGIKKHVTTKP